MAGKMASPLHLENCPLHTVGNSWPWVCPNTSPPDTLGILFLEDFSGSFPASTCGRFPCESSFEPNRKGTPYTPRAARARPCKNPSGMLRTTYSVPRQQTSCQLRNLCNYTPPAGHLFEDCTCLADNLDILFRPSRLALPRIFLRHTLGKH